MFLKIFQNSKFQAVFLVAVVLIVYSNAFFNQFVLDDVDFIVDWPLIQNWSNFPQFFLNYTPPPGQEGIYSPLKTLFHAINYHLFGLNPFGHHVVSLVIHLLGILCVYKISAFLIRDSRCAFLTALFFALHPVQVEAIGFLTASVDMIGVVFMLASFLYFLKTFEKGFEKKFYITSLLFGVLAIYTHELCISLPVLLVWYYLCFLRNNVKWQNACIKVLPYFVIVAVYVVNKFWVLGTITRGKYLYDSFYLTYLLIAKAWLKYIVICFFPMTLSHNQVIAKGISSFDQLDFDKFSVLSQSFFDSHTSIAVIIILSLGFLCCRNFSKNTLLSFCIGWFFICLLPVSHIIPSGVYFAERYLYPGLMAFCLILSVFIGKLIDYKDKKIFVTTGYVLIISLLLGFSFRTWTRLDDWRTDISLFESTVKVNPYSALIRNDLGLLYTKAGKDQKALEMFQEALKLRDNDPVTYFSMADTYTELGQFKNAVDALETALRFKADYAEAYYNLAGLYAHLGFMDKAKENLDQAVYFYRKRGDEQQARELKQIFLEYWDKKTQE